MTRFTLTGAEVLLGDAMVRQPVAVADGCVTDTPSGREIDLTGFWVLPGLVDCHGDGFERHVAPRRGILKDLRTGITAAAAEMAANGITTGTLAQFYSWEGGLRSPEFADRVFSAVRDVAPQIDTDLRLQLRLETHLLEPYPAVLEAVERFGIRYVVFNDHLQHDRLRIGQRPKRLTGQALKAGRNPDDHFAYMISLHQNAPKVPDALATLCTDLKARGVQLGSHDDRTEQDREAWQGFGVHIAEFPETEIAAETATASGDRVVLGAPNVVRGASHAGNVSASDLVAKGLCHALASDYHYPAMRDAVWALVDRGICSLPKAWALVSTAPAQLLGLTDRGTLRPGQRADFVVINQATRQLEATFARGRVTYLSGSAGERFLGAV